MRAITTLLGALFLIGLTTGESLANDPAKEKEKARIAFLIKQLVDDNFAIRQASAKELEAFGPKALPALRTAANESPDVELRQRAARLVQRIIDRQSKD